MTKNKKLLNELIPRYAVNKAELDSYKKICEDENKQIKELMQQEKLEDWTIGAVTAKCIVQRRESMNEDILLEIAHKYKLRTIIKTKEYIDYDALENMLYQGNVSAAIVAEMDKAKEVNDVVTLRLTRKKEKGDE